MKEQQNQENPNKLITYYWTNNVLQKSKFHGIDKQNILEAIVVPFVITVVILVIPFTRIVKLMSIIVTDIVLFTTFIRGYKNRSIFQFIRDEIRFKKNRRVLHLRGVEYKRKKGGQFINYEEDGIIRLFITKSKQRLDDFIEKYDSNNVSKNS